MGGQGIACAVRGDGGGGGSRVSLVDLLAHRLETVMRGFDFACAFDASVDGVWTWGLAEKTNAGGRVVDAAGVSVYGLRLRVSERMSVGGKGVVGAAGVGVVGAADFGVVGGVMIGELRPFVLGGLTGLVGRSRIARARSRW